LRIDEVRRTADFAALSSEWSLLADEAKASIFQTWEWAFSWWEVFGKEDSLRLLTVRDAADRLVGVAPLVLDSRRVGPVSFRTLELVGHHSVSSEYLDLIVSPQHRDAVIAALLDYVAGRWPDRLLHLYRVPASSATLEWVRLNRTSAYYAVLRSEPTLVIQLPQTWEEYLKVLSANTRRNIRRHRTRASSELGAEFEVVIGGCEQHLEQLMELHQARMRSQGRRGSFASAAFVRFHRALLRRVSGRGWSRFFFLSVDGRPVAARYGFVLGGRLFDYSVGLDPAFERYSLGSVLLGHCAEYAIRAGLKYFDFLDAGDYKLHWNPREDPKLTVVLGPTRVASFRTLFGLRARAAGVVRKLLKR
jgi:CelD/BcsL family acetyltransferase involved in cellulose biosynthesis